jgi:hypothetical protein
MARRTRLTIDTIPLYADEEEIGEAVLGFERRKEFRGLAILLERQGLPKISPLLGGRYVPAVKHFFDSYNGLSDNVAPVREKGVEGEWISGRQKKAGIPPQKRKVTQRTPPPKPTES